MGIWFSFLAVIALILIAWVGVSGAGLQAVFGVVLPYLAVAIFFIGMIRKIIWWGRSPVPFRIPTTIGQEKSLPWVKQDKINNPSSVGGVFVRMALEILVFRSLFRNTKTQMRPGPKIDYGEEKWLWLFGLMFHWSFLVVLLRHLRFFTEPVPFWVSGLEKLDGFLEIGLPGVMISGLVLLGAVTLLFIRRVILPQIKYISLAADFFPLILIFAIGATGALMRYFTRIDIEGVKELTMGLVSFHPTVPEGIGVMFYIHVFLVSILFAYFPFSKLAHLGGVFLSPTRNMVNNNRAVRHVNPWNYPVKTHPYEEYEDDFREVMIEAGLPVEKELPPGEGENTDESGTTAHKE